MKKIVYKQIAWRFNALNNCIKNNNKEWEIKHGDVIEQIVDKYLPSGSGIDSGIKFDFDNSKDDRLIFHSSYHVMDENGYYDGWIQFSFVITPSLMFDFNLDIKGRFSDYRDQGASIKDYLHDTLRYALTQEVDE